MKSDAVLEGEVTEGESWISWRIEWELKWSQGLQASSLLLARRVALNLLSENNGRTVKRVKPVLQLWIFVIF